MKSDNIAQKRLRKYLAVIGRVLLGVLYAALILFVLKGLMTADL